MIVLLFIIIVTVHVVSPADHHIYKRTTNDLLSFHCTPQWNSSTHNYSVTLQFNVSDDIISDLEFFYITYITKRKSDQYTLSHHFVTDITPHHGQNTFTYIDEDRSPTDNDRRSIYDIQTIWSTTPSGIPNEIQCTLSLFPELPPQPVNVSVLSVNYDTAYTSQSIEVIIHNISLLWTHLYDESQLQYYLLITGDFVSGHSSRYVFIINNVTKSDNEFLGNVTDLSAMYVNKGSPFLQVQIYSQYTVSANGRLIYVNSSSSLQHNITITKSSTTSSTSSVSTPLTTLATTTTAAATTTTIAATATTTAATATTAAADTTIVATATTTAATATTITAATTTTIVATATTTAATATTITAVTTTAATTTTIAVTATTAAATATTTAATTTITMISSGADDSTDISYSITESVSVTGSGASSSNKETNTIIIVISVLFVILGVAALVVTFIGCWCNINRKKFKEISEGLDSTERNEDLIAIFRNNGSQPSVVFTGHTSDSMDLAFSLHTDQWEIPMDVIQFDHLLGEGCFGEVYLGRLREDFTSPMLTSHFRQSNNKGFVAIKLLKPTASSSEKNDFLKEIELMKKISSGKNQRVVNMLGSVTIQEPMLLVTEFVVHGDLLTYLRASRKKIVFRRTHKGASLHHTEMDENEQKSMELGVIESNDLVSFAYQITSGMEYLSSLQVVHRDLACRNILVGEEKSLKITDFGMSRMIYHDSAYVKTSKGKLPLKWMSIESILDRVFTSASDVWSFGICLWEIATLGHVPYPTISNEDLLPMLTQGYRMEKPSSCSDEIYEIMLSCWGSSPEDRPVFTELRQKFDNIISRQHENYIDLSMSTNDPIDATNPIIIEEQASPPKESKHKEDLSTSRLSNFYVDSPSHSFDGRFDRPNRLSFQGTSDTLCPNAATPGGVSLPANDNGWTSACSTGSHLNPLGTVAGQFRRSTFNDGNENEYV